jgi:hypothetical protein
MRGHMMVPSTILYGNHAFASEILINLGIQILICEWIKPS